MDELYKMIFRARYKGVHVEKLVRFASSCKAREILSSESRKKDLFRQVFEGAEIDIDSIETWSFAKYIEESSIVMDTSRNLIFVN
ncbi:MAG: hypothetical protein KC478_17585 [Bacteriovoracaceae bacterium]|nr:hypothetical protein [Bacteriovoracaceae bacterium]